MKVAAIDLGGTRSKASLVEVTDGQAPRILRRLVPEDVMGLDADAALTIVIEQVREMGDADVVGLSLPGLHDGGMVTALPGKFPGMQGRDVVQQLHAATGLPCHLANDAVSAGVGEAVAGAAAGASIAVVVTIGTGVGCCVIMDGAPIGRGPLAGGLLGGQIPIGDPHGPTDTSGRAGTIEARCRAEQIVALARAQGFLGQTVSDVVESAIAGQASAIAGIADWQVWFVRALVALTHAHVPDVIVVGGGPLSTSDVLLHGVQEELAAATWDGCDPEVLVASLGDVAGTVGIAHLAARAKMTPA